MRQTVECTKCGAPNELTTMFCRECGTKLDFSTLQHEHFEDEGHPIAKRVLEAVGGILLLLALVAVGLMLWPTPSTGQQGNSDQATEARRFIVRLHDAASNNIRARVVLSEPALNAYLANILLRGQAESDDDSSWLKLESINVSWDETSTQVHVARKIGPVTITNFIEGTPSVGGGVFRFDVDRARMGHLPLFGPASLISSGAIGRALADLEHERFILEHLSSLELKDGQARLVTSGS